MKIKNIFWSIIFFIILSKGYCQNGEESFVYAANGDKIYSKNCLYPGGQDQLLKDIASNFILPRQAKKNKVEGKIFLQMIVDTSGFARGKILKGLRPDVDSAAIDMVKKLKQFAPALTDNKKVPATMNIPLKL